MALKRRAAPKKKAANAKKLNENKTSGQPDASTLPFKFVSLQSPPGDTFVDGTSGITGLAGWSNGIPVIPVLIERDPTPRAS
jgi:hypothetical protein